IKPSAPRNRNVAAATEVFHHDSSFNVQPSKWSMLRGVECPPAEFGGATLFCDLRAAYDDLEPSMKKRLGGLRGIHDFWEGRRRAGLESDDAMRAGLPLPPVTHRLVRILPYGRKTLFIGGHCIGIEAMDDDAADALLAELYYHATQSKYVHRHEWTEGDLVIWDNRCVLHAATPLNTDAYRRDMRRATVNDAAWRKENSALLTRRVDRVE
ncbi:MAG: TauD/TfdA dioxygenase family protein, partial [Pollutimonas bauzanensis]